MQEHRRMPRGETHSKWADDPLRRVIREELEKRDWNLTMLGERMGRAPSLISRWMRGQQMSYESLLDVAEVFGLDSDYVLRLGGRLPGDPMGDDPRVAALIAKVRLIDLTDDRYYFLEGALEAMRRRPINRQSVAAGSHYYAQTSSAPIQRDGRDGERQ